MVVIGAQAAPNCLHVQTQFVQAGNASAKVLALPHQIGQPVEALQHKARLQHSLVQILCVQVEGQLIRQFGGSARAAVEAC